ncbi:MAG: hypothetical protein LBG74_05120 [Spirochaetaceae bacterium]|jgi:hypothetical protein|nr:hypothetical protein [Spirochaetaceae bacterium]
MKFSRYGITALMGAVLGGAALLMPSAADAQDTREKPQPVNQTEFYVKQVMFDKIYTAPQGYIIQYREGVLGDKKIRVAVPYTWFDKAVQESGGDNKVIRKGEMVQIGSGQVWPHLVVYYKSGVLDHIRLYVSKYPNHPTWGTAHDTPAVQKLFSESENWKL